MTRDFSTLIREKCHGSSRPDPHETRISRVARIVSGRVGSGQDVFGISRVGSGRVRRCLECRGSGRVGSGGFQKPAGRVGSGQVKTSRNSYWWGRVRRGGSRQTHPDPRVMSRPVKGQTFLVWRQCRHGVSHGGCVSSLPTNDILV